MRNFSIVIFSSVLVTVGWSGCKKPSADENKPAEATEATDDSEDDEETEAGTLEVTTDLSLAVPDSLAISVFPQTVDNDAVAAGTIAVSLMQDVSDPAKQTMRQKIAFQRDVINGVADSCISEESFNALKAVSERCYEFDQDMMYGAAYPQGGSDTGKYYGTVDGKNSKGEACLVAFAREEVSDVVSMVDQAMGLVQAALCQANKDGKDVKLPDVGGDMDLASPLSTALNGRLNIEVDSGTLTRLEDSDGRAVYRTTIVISRLNKKRTINIVHSPAADGTNDTFDGRLWVDMEGSFGPSAPQPGPNQEAKHSLFSIQYTRTIDATLEEPRIQYELRSAEMSESIAEQAFEEGILNLNASTNGAGAYVKSNGSPYGNNEGASNIKYVSFDMNPDTNAGTLSYWRNPGQNYDENTRGLIFNLAYDDAGALGGCANSGSASVDFSSGMSIRKALKTGAELSPAGFWHPFMRTQPLDQGCSLQSSPSGDTDGTGTYLQLACPGGPGGGNKTVKWYKPKISAQSIADEFSTKSEGAYITRQCYKQNSRTGAYDIDSSAYTVAEEAGYELVATTDTSKVVKPPQFELPPPPPNANFQQPK